MSHILNILILHPSHGMQSIFFCSNVIKNDDNDDIDIDEEVSLASQYVLYIV